MAGCLRSRLVGWEYKPALDGGGPRVGEVPGDSQHRQPGAEPIVLKHHGFNSAGPSIVCGEGEGASVAGPRPEMCGARRLASHV